MIRKHARRVTRVHERPCMAFRASTGPVEDDFILMTIESSCFWRSESWPKRSMPTLISYWMGQQEHYALVNLSRLKRYVRLNF